MGFVQAGILQPVPALVLAQGAGPDGGSFVAVQQWLHDFEAQMRRMAGLDDDGIVDAIFRISKPVSGAYFWCLDLRLLGL